MNRDKPAQQRYTLLPLHAVAGSRNYVPHLIRDIYNIAHVWTGGIRASRKQNFTVAGTPADFVAGQEMQLGAPQRPNHLHLLGGAAGFQQAPRDPLPVLSCP